ncbi:peptidase S8 [Actinomadura barringtoniae]|uniref:Peptidase S8 n=1 Tax=Actinomadura barringtoniae TaxID=1427535 RepID=A0A939T2L6_9ACTN|nr:S8 family peptidase [Actinomadura barringtoniae]MBO2446828.1 peptidase S8 [Actinomadura barringtoniae]
MVLATLVACGSDDKADPMAGKQWGLDAMKLPDAWKTTKGKDVVIAVVDTGTDTGHPDLKDHIVKGYDFVSGDDDPKDQNGHGTHVSGIAAAVTDNGVGIAGDAPDAKIMPVRALDTLGSGDNQTITKAIMWAADHGAKVINLSLGESGLMSRFLKGGVLNAAFTYAYGKGAVVVAAAGNDSTFKQPYQVTTPVLIVGASDQDGKPASFSNFGAQQAVSAPGVHILSTLPTYKTQETLKNTSGYGYLDGTSMAAPQVSGLAALLIAQGRSPAQTMQIIRQTAKNPSGDARLGLGIVDAAAAVGAPKDK